MEEILGRVWSNLIGRLDGPMHVRFFIQPAVAAFLAIRAGIRDSRNDRPPFLWALLKKGEHRAEVLRQGWTDVGKVFILAVTLDLIYQLVFLRRIHPFELFLTASLLALLPYALLHGPVNRIARRFRRNREPETQTDTK